MTNRTIATIIVTVAIAIMAAVAFVIIAQNNAVNELRRECSASGGHIVSRQDGFIYISQPKGGLILVPNVIEECVPNA